MRFAIRVLALCTANAMLGAAAPDRLAAIAAANGHLAAVHIRATATRRIEGRTVVTTFDQLGTAQLLRRCVAEVCGGVWFDGRRRWTFGLNEVPLPEADDDATRTQRTLAAIESFAFAEPAFSGTGGSVSAAGTDRWEVRAHDGAPLVAILDRATSALRRVQTPAGETIAAFGGEVRAGGAAFALQRAGPFESGPLDAAAAVTAPLTAPDGAPATFAGDGSVALADSALPIVPCTLNGRSVRCLLDSGATPSAITLPLAERLGLEPRGEIQMQAIGSFVTGFVTAGPLVIGAARFASARFAVVPPTRAASFDVAVGADLLGRVRLVLDGRRREAKVLSPAPEPPANAVPLDLAAGTPSLEVTIGGTPGRALLDTGDAATLSIGYAAYREGPQWPVTGRSAASGVAGTEDALLVDVPDLRVGTHDLGPVSAVVRRTQATPHLGSGVWAKGEVEVDESAGAMTFRP
jgi:hypothetical protein